MYEHVTRTGRVAINISRVSYALLSEGDDVVVLTFDHENECKLRFDNTALALEEYGKIKRMMEKS